MSWQQEVIEFSMCTPDELNVKIENVVAMQKEQYGWEPSGHWCHMYCGSVKIDQTIFDDESSAHKYLENVLKRDSSLIAVKFFDMSISETETSLRNKLEENANKISKQIKSVSNRIKKASKNAYNCQECPHCKNRHGSTFLTMNRCGLCYTPYWTKEDLDKRTVLLDKETLLKKEIDDEKVKPVTTGTLKWLVGGECPA